MRIAGEAESRGQENWFAYQIVCFVSAAGSLTEAGAPMLSNVMLPVCIHPFIFDALKLAYLGTVRSKPLR